MHGYKKKFSCIMVWAALMLSAPPISASVEFPQLQTNQAYVDQLLLPKTLGVKNVSSVLSFILNRLPDEVLVYPTENYYYFNFLHNGLKYAGNLRLDASDRDAGKIHLAYFVADTEWSDISSGKSVTLSLTQGVKVDRIDPLKYRVSFRGRQVVFKLNDLSHIKPPAEMIAKGEVYIGPIFDESAIQFFLIYNKPVKKFHYILNRVEKFPDILNPDKMRSRIHISQRTGFVFYQDHLKDRLILIGVYQRNAVANNYFDGPFDQLPDNFIKGDMLKKAFIDQNPARAGTIDRFGNAPDGNSRISISPYFHYLTIDELYGFDECAQKNKDLPQKYYACFDAQKLGVE